MVFGIDDLIIGGTIASIGSSALGYAGQQQANQMNKDLFYAGQDFNSAEAEKNRSFQYGMSAGAHQREMEDLRKAGLNPMLAAKLSGAPMGGGSSASSPGAPTLGSPMSKIANSGVDMVNMMSSLAAQKASTDLNKASTVGAIQDANLTSNSAAVAKEKAKQAAMETMLLEKGLTGEVTKIDVKNKMTEMDKKFAEDHPNINYWINKLGINASSALQGASVLRGAGNPFGSIRWPRKRGASDDGELTSPSPRQRNDMKPEDFEF